MSQEIQKQNQYDLIISKALSTDVDIDKLTALMEMKERYDKSQAKKDFVLAMSEFKAECPTVLKTARSHTSTYADLGMMIEAVTPVLSKHGLSHSWGFKQNFENNKMLIEVTCTITHKAGHSESVALVSYPDSGGKMNEIQRIGSTTTYLERYTFVAITGLAVKKMDDDGNSAVGKKEAPARETISEKSLEELRKLVDGMSEKAADKFNAVLRKRGTPTLHDVLEIDVESIKTWINANK